MSSERHAAADMAEQLLQGARKGDVRLVLRLLSGEEDGSSKVEINCKGKHKSNLGWSPLHLAAYFGHKDVVEPLLKYGADVNILNGMGDTPLHRAAFTGRTNVVLLLLEYNADVSIINGEGRTPLQMANSDEVRDLIEAAEKSQKLYMNEELLEATREGYFEKVKELLASNTPPNINCQDLMGNTPLHCAAYRGHKELAVLLLQNGVDSTIRNKRGLTALDLARDQKMCQLLDVQPLQAVQKTVQRFEGYLLKRTRFFGPRKHWVVLERGILSAFNRRADAASGIKRQFFKYLDNAKFHSSHEDSYKFKVQYSDHTVHMWSVVPSAGQVDRQRWLNAFKEHCAYSTHYTSMPHIILMDELDDDYLPLGSIEDALKNAKAHQQLLDQQVLSLVSYFSSLQDQQIRQGTATNLKFKLNEVVASSQEVCQTLSHCLTILSQQEEVRRLQYEGEVEKRRVLEDALHVLAQEHHALEKSVQIKKQQGNNGVIETESDFEDFEEFYDAPMEFMDSFEGSSDKKYNGIASDLESSSSNEICDPLRVNSILKNNVENGYDSTPEKKSRKKQVDKVYVDGQFSTTLEDSLRVTKTTPGKYRNRLPHKMHSRSEFSTWTVLKQAIGKDLSRIAMPVIFNEPLSMLQRLVEYFDQDFIRFIKEATEIDDPLERMLRIASFAVSSQAPNHNRVGKPFNPLLGETFELIREDLGVKLISEQVSHHPPVSAVWLKGADFELHLSLEPTIKFWGKDIEVKTKGSITLEIPKYNEAYTSTTVHTGVHNIIVGTMWIELYGVIEITNHRNGYSCVMNFKPAGWFGKDLHQVEGYVLDPSKKKKMLIKGDWTTYLCSISPDTPEVLDKEFKVERTDEEIKLNFPKGANLLWKVNPKPLYAAEMYNMTEFAMSLNELRDEHKGVIAPTDARLRPDISALEHGDIELAANEKFRLEEKQRAARRDRNKTGEKWKSKWFEYKMNPYTGVSDWIYMDAYFQRDWTKCPKIY